MIDFDTFRDLLTKRREAGLKLQSPDKTAAITQESNTKLSKSKSSKGRPKKQRKVTSASSPDVLGLKNEELDAPVAIDAYPQSLQRSKEELFMECSSLLTKRDEALSLISEYQQQLERTLKRLEELNSKKHDQVNRLKQVRLLNYCYSTLSIISSNLTCCMLGPADNQFLKGLVIQKLF
jgi:hypothetical protein